ncbi:ATP-binding cassette domain-containing protein [Streptomyces sp. NBC_01497]|uniref:ATP-binding cassette domain-containing protein n=1 Tax=Streptomyces sp. NBC_01497 TaxID=2903885 RepID=UPI002E308E78|nr:ATP-binding cassette domain-containing protein [Streptomyces sp. NBC_01497]
MPGAIYAEGLVKTFGDVRALDGVDLDVPEGTVLGLLGPNGAGKTTAVRVLTTLLRPDSGRAVVAGVDVLKHPNDVRRSIGLSGQFAAVDEYLTGRENLRMVGRLYQLSGRQSKARADELLERFHLTDAGDRTIKTYSGGMRRRLDLAAALVVSPPVMFMDEPTTGLDPRNRQQLWTIIQELVAVGTTLLLTTQYLEEADHLAHDIAVVDRGSVIARGTADELKARTGGERVEVVVHEPRHIATARGVLRGFGTSGTVAGDASVTVVEHTRKLTVPVSGGAKLLAEVIRELDARGIEIDDIGLRRPTLDDVFLSLTGHAAEDADAGDEDGAGSEGRARSEDRTADRPPAGDPEHADGSGTPRRTGAETETETESGNESGTGTGKGTAE